MMLSRILTYVRPHCYWKGQNVFTRLHARSSLMIIDSQWYTHLFDYITQNSPDNINEIIVIAFIIMLLDNFFCSLLNLWILFTQYLACKTANYINFLVAYTRFNIESVPWRYSSRYVILHLFLRFHLIYLVSVDIVRYSYCWCESKYRTYFFLDNDGLCFFFPNNGIVLTIHYIYVK